MRFQSFKWDNPVFVQKIRVTVVILMFLAWITLTLLLYFLPPSTYQDLSEGWIWVVAFLGNLLFLFSFPAFVGQPPKWVIKLLDRRFTMEILYCILNFFVLLLPIRKRQHFYWLITAHSPHPALLVFLGGLTFFLVFFWMAAAWIRIKILLDLEKRSTLRSETLSSDSSQDSTPLILFLISLALLFVVIFPLLAFFYKQEIEELFGIPLFFSLTNHIKHIITTCLVIFLLPPLASFMRLRKHKPKFLIPSFFLLFLIYFLNLYPLSNIIVDPKDSKQTPATFVFLSSISGVVHLSLFINVVVRYQELLDAERSFKKQQRLRMFQSQ